MNARGGSLIEAIKRRAARALAEAQAQARALSEAQAQAFTEAQARVQTQAQALAETQAQAQARRQRPQPARAAAEATVPARPALVRPAEVEPAQKPESLLAPLRGGRGFLAAFIVSEALLPPLSLRERGPNR
jgi:septum formation inhibitor MinC